MFYFCAFLCFSLCINLIRAQSYVEYCVGSCGNSRFSQPRGGILAMGGSTDVDNGFRSMNLNNDGGNFLVLRASGSDGYNDYIYRLGPVQPNNVRSIVCLTSECAFNTVVINHVRNAQAIFFAGGDQWNYVRMFSNTPLAAAIRQRIDSNAVIGGTSAGLAILAEFIFTAEFDTVTSPEALRDPMIREVSVAPNRIFDLRVLRRWVTDSHFQERDRMGRMLTFMARINNDIARAPGETTYAMGVNERTCMFIETTGSSAGIGTVLGSSQVYIAASATIPEVCQRGMPLSFASIGPAIEMSRLRPNQRWNFNTQTGDGVRYQLRVRAGVVEGPIYGPADIFAANVTEVSGK